MSTKLCSKCEIEKPLGDFYTQQRSGQEYVFPYCKDCAGQKAQAWQRDNANRWNQQRRQRRYGITQAEFEQLQLAQNALCAICHQPETRYDGQLSIDHCHITGAVRGLLCHRCNSALGLLRDDPKLLRAAISYLEP